MLLATMASKDLKPMVPLLLNIRLRNFGEDMCLVNILIFL